MARKKSEYIELDGPLFDADMTEKVNDAVAEGIEELGEDAAEIMVSFISAAGFVASGAFISSTDSVFKRSGRGVVGFAKVTPTDTWSGSITLGHAGATTKSGKAKLSVTSVSSGNNRPPKTWLATGTRGGKKLRPGNNVWAKTATRVNAMKVQRIADKIAKALE